MPMVVKFGQVRLKRERGCSQTYVIVRSWLVFHYPNKEKNSEAYLKNSVAFKYPINFNNSVNNIHSIYVTSLTRCQQRPWRQTLNCPGLYCPPYIFCSRHFSFRKLPSQRHLIRKIFIGSVSFHFFSSKTVLLFPKALREFHLIGQFPLPQSDIVFIFSKAMCPHRIFAS